MEEWNKWSSIIRSCVLTSKSPLTPCEINRDINMLEGTNIPYQQLNCRSLDEMLRKVSGLKVFTKQGKTVIQAIPTEETAHISKMVKLQKSSKKKPRTLPSVFNKKSSSYNDFKSNKTNVSYNQRNSYSKYSVPNTRLNSWDFQKRPQTNSIPYQDSFTATSSANSSQSKEYKIEQVKKACYLASKIPVHPNSPSLRFSSSPQRLSPTSHRHNFNPNHFSPSKKHSNSISQHFSPSSQHSSPPLQRSSLPPNRSSPPPQRSSSPLHRHNFSPYRFRPSQRFSPPPLLPMAQMQKSVNFVPLLAQSNLVALGPSTDTSRTTELSSIAKRLNVVQGSITQTSRISTSASNDPRLRLNSYTESRRLSLPTYKDLPTKNNFIYSSVTVNSKKYSSYPKEAKTKEEAEKLAAQVALDELLGKDIKPPVTTVNKDLIKTRILKIVNDYPNGLFESSIVEYYTEKYNEGLPENWIKVVEQLITLDIGANNLTILSPQNKLQVYRSSNTVAFEPEVLKLSSNMEEFWLHIYVIYNVTDIWGVIIDENHSDKIDELAKDMKMYYDADRSEILQAIPSKYYAVFDSEWHRVRCVNVDPVNQTTTVFFIDRGDKDTFLLTQLRTLHPKFCQLSGQAVRLSMAGLETFYDCDEMQVMLEDLLVDKDVYVRRMKYEQNQKNTSSAQLYLEKDNDEVNVNELLKSEIMKKIFDPTINMQSDKIAQDVYISYVSEKSVFVQLKSKGLTHLKMLMKNLAKDCLNNSYFKSRPILRYDKTKIYVAKNIADSNWYRVKITKFENEDQVQVYCIDEGNTLTVKKSDLILLEDLSGLLDAYPHQAIQVRLHKISPITFDKKMAKHLRNLAPKTNIFYMKVVDKVEDLPMVEFYKRTEDNYLASLNDTLALESEITSKDDNNNAKLRIRNDRSSIESCSEFPLKAPSIPLVNSFFDVYIVMAAHPGNFTVQSLNSIQKLEKLMANLLKVCQSYTGPPITPSDIKVGCMYAAKYDDDGKWYRAYVSKIISKNICAIYFCDYGDYRTVSLEQLQPLPNQFFDLPYQAIKAKLYGVTPRLKGDWTVKDSLRFNDLVVTKSFVSVIKSYDMNNISGETILGLELIDTSTSEDIYISNILVHEKRADKVEDLKV